jgi:hypothetical protein
MLRPIVFSCLYFISIHSAFAQIAFGAKAGLNLANWTTEGHNTITAFNGGAIAQFPLGENFSIQPEFIYEGKGTDLSDFIPNNPMRFTLKYLTMPALLGYQARGITFRLGPYVSYLLDSHIEINSKGVEKPEAFEKWDWGVTGGATLDIASGFGFEVLYYFGFRDVVELTFVDQNGQYLAKLDDGMNRVLQLGLYYKVSSE